jgi:hypothetical protein
MALTGFIVGLREFPFIPLASFHFDSLRIYFIKVKAINWLL